MEFCPTCGTRLILEQGDEGKGPWLSCPRCRYRELLTETSSPSPRKRVSPPRDDTVVVVEGEERFLNLLTIRFNCPKCENDLAYKWNAQTQWTDESQTQFYRCTRCGYTVRG